MKQKILNILITICIISGSLITPFNTFAASEPDFEVINDLTLRYTQGKDYAEVTESITYKVNNEKYIIQPGLITTFYLGDYSKTPDSRQYKLNTLKISNQSDVVLKYEKVNDAQGTIIKVSSNEKVAQYSDYTITATYRSKDLLNINGNIVNLYVPGLSNETKFTESGKYNLITEYKYNTKIITNLETPNPSFIQPTTITQSQNDKNKIYDIPQKDRVGHMAWLQFGSNQYYKFKLEQIALKTDNITPSQISNIAPIVSTNIYKIALPREYDETNQNVLITNITPKPISVERDFTGNLIATFEVPANENTQITIEGYISLSKTSQTKLNDMNLAQYKNRLSDLPDLATYTSADKYWETQDPLVKEIAQDLMNKSSSILELVNNDYTYIVNKFTYSTEKLNNGNIRLGAKAALSGSQTICMEYSDALTAILRAQGIPARIAIGYGNDPQSVENKISNTKLEKQTIGHQWTQVWIPDYGWLSVDPTWGESQRKYIGSDLDHILWYTIGSSKQNVTDVLFYSAEHKNLGDYNIYLQALTESEFKTEAINTTPLNQMIISNMQQGVDLNLYIKTSFAGRILVYLIPIATALTLSTLITSIIYFFKRKYKSHQDL